MIDAQGAILLATDIAGSVVELGGVASVILHGSLASGHYEAGRSDIDLLVVTEETLDAAQKRWLFDSLCDLLSPSPTALDLRVVTHASANAPTRIPVIDVEIAAHPPSNELQVVAERASDPDLLVEFAVCRAYGRALHGVDPSEVIGSVNRAWLLEDADQELAKWQRVHAEGRVPPIVPLTACRMWRFAVDNAFCSKHDAAQWVLDRMPDCEIVIEAARANRGERGLELERTGLPELLARTRIAVQESLAEFASSKVGR